MPQNNYSQEDIRIILRAALKGDREAAVTLLQNYTNEMYFAARLYLEDKADAKKTVQNAFNTAYTRLQEAEHETDFAAWLRSIVRECAIKRISPLQAETAEVPYSSDDERASGELSLPDEKTCRKYLLQGFAVFTAEERLVATMRYYDHLTVDRIAEILGTSRGHVEDWLSCGKEALHRAGILIGRIIALIDAINDVPAVEETPSYEPRHASGAVVFPEDPDNENTAFRNFRDLSNEPLPVTEEEKKEEPVKTNLEESRDTIVLPRMTEVKAPKVAPIEEEKVTVNDSEDDDDEEEEENSVVTTVIIVISLLILLGAGIFFLYQFKPELFSWVPFLNNSAEVEQTPEETAVPTTIPTEAPVAETTPVPEQPAAPETTSLGTVTVAVDSLNVRSTATMDGAIVGTVSLNEQFTVLETYNDGTQNWYRIGDGQWVTDGGLGYVNYAQ